ncbi:MULTISPECIES: helix-turn-helix transcriptional regulator [Bradyrhizobium]|uniref:helix-turn-helix domain-containing protein n=1 Tax=Bradyrhizobium TaxID=374 RepID=UPI001FF9F753|nr:MULTISPECIES: helix-turn-helix transcriptional regulator [Bradyrhizobium]MCK1338563.1 helix-turn-helix transcriptional regulator [Bradyrhizobium sp. 38]MCK1425839.1 helix-turn-helix transcriptional regulator [Bradyrhizobium sp. 87]MCK1734357.1 helix-turn-helix transcriptional regulator [Bradyrhizobium sp. 138]MCK1778671.1 helix-turn-helix transcriptional regulator [Bradyrhizobium sp. 132]MDF0522888.1 helix-turn-helix transcriptional regulator [Bradyrhizobium yuanmingense]
MKARALVAWNVRRIRVDRGVSQERLAYDARIDRSYMGGIEQQSENPTIDLLDRIAETLGVHLSEFFLQPPKGATAPKPLRKGRKPVPPRSRKK